MGTTMSVAAAFQEYGLVPDVLYAGTAPTKLLEVSSPVLAASCNAVHYMCIGYIHKLSRLRSDHRCCAYFGTGYFPVRSEGRTWN